MDGYGSETQVMIHSWLTGFSMTAPTTPKYCMLSTASFKNDGYGMEEVLQIILGGPSGYDRSAIADGTGNWYAPTNSGTPGVDDLITESKNFVEISFGPSATGKAWGTIQAFAIMRTDTPVIPPSTDPEIYFGGDLDDPKTIEGDTVAVFASGNLKLQTLNTI